MTLTDAIGWAIVHSIWQGAVIAVVLAGALMLVRHVVTVRYAMACAALGLFVTGFLFTAAVYLRTPVDARPAAVAVRLVSDALRSSVDLAQESNFDAARRVLAILWGLGAFVMAAYRTAGWLAVRSLRRKGVCAIPSEWTSRLDALRARLELARPVSVLASALVETPVVTGVWKPVILFPASILSGLPVAQVEALLLHELAHVRRWDLLVQRMQILVESLLFFHPATWWISKVINREREYCCDDLVIEVSGTRTPYAEALLAVEQQRQPAPQFALAAAAYTSGDELMLRMKRILYRTPANVEAPLACIALGLACGAFAITGSTAAAQTKVESPYEKWLNQDVVYIIEPAEKAAFQRMGSDEERQKFIEQFWARRGSEKVKEEHYRRIRYANERFRNGDTQGWRTDRGRIYIQMGPPDEIESHPAEQKDQWLYRNPRKILEFRGPKYELVK